MSFKGRAARLPLRHVMLLGFADVGKSCRLDAGCGVAFVFTRQVAAALLVAIIKARVTPRLSQERAR